jgi:WD40 repeat protein/nucleoside phosphorylase
MAGQAQYSNADVLLVTATKVEATAVLHLFEKPQLRRIGDKTYYDLGVVNGANVFLVQTEMGTEGPGGATLTVRQAIYDLSPSAVIMVGIAFGVNKHEQRIGDILVSKQLLVYESQRIGTGSDGRATITMRGDRPLASLRLLDRFRSGDLDWQGVTVRFGLLFSGNKLIDNKIFRDQLLKVQSDAIGGEMEGAGVCAAAQQSKVDWILVKAICDWADGNKAQDKDLRQQMAAENAARFTLHVLRRGGFTRSADDADFSRSHTSPVLGTTLYTYDEHASWVVAVAWEPNGTRIASAGGDGTVRVWDVDTGERLRTYRGHTRRLAKAGLPPTVYNVAWSPDGQSIVSAGDGAKVHVWNPVTGENSMIYQGHSGSGLLPNVYAVAWSPDSTRIASACSSVGLDKTVHIWDVATGKIILHCRATSGLNPSFSVLAVAWSPDGTRIAATWGDKTIRVWNAVNGSPIATYVTDADWVSDLAWSPDCRLIATANSDATAQIRNTTTGDLIRTYSGHSVSVRDVAWSPDGTCIASASNDKTVQIWNPFTGDNLFTYRCHSDWTTALAWSPDGVRIASASNDKTVKIWQARGE